MNDLSVDNDLMKEFGYLIEKIESANFTEDPFRFIIIDDFLSREHFEQITTAPEINMSEASKTEDLIDNLLNNGYKVQEFPGCTTSVKDYLKCYNSEKWPTDKGMIEGYGLTFRLEKYNTDVLSRLVSFLNSPEFKSTLESKFGLTESNYVETAIQKYLHGYEISPHPDIRKKAATYMLNINTSNESEKVNIHTYLMKFKPSKQYIYDFWRYNKNIDRCWVPWDWCESKFETTVNNSIVLFSPSDDSLHAVKLDYDHLKFQRTQVYGNLWYDDRTTDVTLEYNDIDLLNNDKLKEQKKGIKSMIPAPIKSVIKKVIK